MATVYYRQVLTGGGSTALDNTDGDNLADNDMAFVLDGTTFYVYQLDAASGAAESSPNVIAPDTNPGNKRWILQGVQNAVVGLTYTEITTATNLAVGNRYVCKNTAATHTLPELSTLSDGDQIQVMVTGGDVTVVVNEHANDSNAELATFYARGDGALFTVVDGAWEVSGEVVTVYGKLALSADDSVSATSNEKIFDANYTVVSNVGGWWDSVTNHRGDPAFDAVVELQCNLFGPEIQAGIRLAGTTHKRDGSTASANYQENGVFHTIEELTATTDYFEAWAWNADSATRNAQGDANLDESIFTWRVVKRIR